MSSPTEIVPVFDFDAAVVALKKDKNQELNLTDILADLATVPVTPPPTVKKKVDKAVVAHNHEEARAALSVLQGVFGTAKEPVTRRLLCQTELAQIEQEKVALAEAKKALAKRETELNEWLSQHFDVYAEKNELVTEKTPKDAKGHYLIGGPGKRLEQPVGGSGRVFARQKEADKPQLNHEMLLAALAENKITRAEYLAYTKPTRVIDEKKIRAAMLSRKKQKRVQEIIEMITQIRWGKLSIRMY